MLNTTFKIIYLILFLPFVVVRKYYERKNKANLKLGKISIIEMTALIITGIGMVVPLVYVFSGKLDFANYPHVDWLTYVGIIPLLIGIIMLWQSHKQLDTNWTIVPALRKNHTLITTGVYKYIRHPMYSAHFAWGLGQMILLPNWIAGPSLMICIIPMFLIRIEAEEKMMIKEFGTEYKEYMKRTGRILPKI